MKLEIQSDNKKVQRHLEELRERLGPKSIYMALNDTTKHVASQAKKQVAAETGIAQKMFKRRIAPVRNERASLGRLVAKGFVGENPIRVRHLTPKPRQLKSGVTKYKTLPGQGLDPSSFVARYRPNQEPSAYARTGRPRFPIKEKTVEVGPYLRRASRIAVDKSLPFYEKRLFGQMARLIDQDLRRRGISSR